MNAKEEPVWDIINSSSSSYYYHDFDYHLSYAFAAFLLHSRFAWSQPQEPAQDNAYAKAKTEHVQVGDINIAYKRFGQGKPILFISGTSQTKDAWEPTLLLELAATNHTVIVFDNRGIGETTVGTKPFSIEQFAYDTAGLLDALQIEKADVFGASLGSFVAQELALNYPKRWTD